MQTAAGNVQVVVDPQQPVVVPLVAGHAVGRQILPEPLVPLVPGFSATFSLINSTPVNRVFEFAWQYWADHKIVFRLYDSSDTLIWQSVQIPVDKPPLAQPVDLTLSARGSWRQSQFVPLEINGALLADGHYRLEAALSGTPEYLASAALEVKNVIGGPIVQPPPGTGIKGLAQVGPVTPVTRPGVPNVKPLPGAIIKVEEIRKIGVFYIHPPFSGQVVADDQGNFSIDVYPGSYTVTGLPPNAGARFPIGSSQTVQVKDGSYTSIVVNYDSGIR